MSGQQVLAHHVANFNVALNHPKSFVGVSTFLKGNHVEGAESAFVGDG